MKNKIIMAAALTAAMVQMQVFADTLVMNLPVLSENDITISGKLEASKAEDAKNRPVTVEVIKPGGDRNNIEDIFYVWEFVTDQSGTGTFSTVLKMTDDDEGGIYKVYIKGRDIEPAAQEFVYVSLTSRRELVDEIKNCATREELDSVISDANTQVILQGMGVSTEDYEELSQKGREPVYSFLLSDNYDADNFAVQMCEAVALGGVNTAYDDENNNPYEIFLKNAQTLGVKTDENSLWNWLGELGEELVEALVKGKEYKTKEDFYNTYMELGVVKAFSSASYNQMENLLNIANDYLKLDLTYGGQTTKKGNILRALVGNYTTSKQICDRFNDAVENAKKPTNTGNNTSSNKGSSSGGGGYSVKAPVAENKPIESEDNKDTENKQESNIGFADLDNVKWAADKIIALSKKGVLDGDGKGNFRPNDTMTREEFAKVIVSAFGLLIEGSESKFIDVDNSKWYAPYVASANAAGIVYGKDDGSFGIGELVSREDMAVMLDRIITARGITLEKVRKMEDFSDMDEISVYAKSSVEKLYRAEVLNGMGNGSFEPKSATTRAQAAVMTAAVLDIIAKIEA